MIGQRQDLFLRRHQSLNDKAMNPTEQITFHMLCLMKDRKWSWHWLGILRAMQTGIACCL